MNSDFRHSSTSGRSRRLGGRTLAALEWRTTGPWKVGRRHEWRSQFGVGTELQERGRTAADGWPPRSPAGGVFFLALQSPVIGVRALGAGGWRACSFREVKPYVSIRVFEPAPGDGQRELGRTEVVEYAGAVAARVFSFLVPVLG
jgi:hypothetical protein